MSIPIKSLHIWCFIGLTVNLYAYVKTEMVNPYNLDLTTQNSGWIYIYWELYSFEFVAKVLVS